MENSKLSVESPVGKIHPLHTFMEHKAAVETVEVYTVPVPAKKANAIVNAFREVLPPQNRSGLDLQHLRRLVREEFLSKQVLARMKATAAENALAVKFDMECAIVDAEGDQAQEPTVVPGPKSRTSSTGSDNSNTSQRSPQVLTVQKPSDANVDLAGATPGEEQKELSPKKKPRRRSSAEKRAAKREREKAALKRLQALEANGGILDCAIVSGASSPSGSLPTSPIESTSHAARSSSTIPTLDTKVDTKSAIEISSLASQIDIATHAIPEESPRTDGDLPPSANSILEANPLSDPTNGTIHNDENTPPTGAGRARKRRRRSSGNKRRARSGSSVSGSTEASGASAENGQNSSNTRNSSPKSHSPPKKPIKQNMLYLLIAPVSAIDLTTVYSILRPFLFPTFPEVSTIEVPSHASISQEQADEWSALYWPAIYKRGNPFGPHPPYVEQTINKVLPKIPEYIALIREAAKQAHESGNGIEVGALVVDPSNEEVVVIAGDGRHMTFGGDERARDCTWGNPLEHAVMRAVGMVASKRKLREDLEIGTRIDTEEGIELMKARESSLRHKPCTEIEKKYFYSINKKQQPATAIITTDNSATTGEDTVPLVDTEKKARESKETGEYLCHNHIVYITHEPCVMCSMALIHSRIGMVVIDGKNKARHPGWGGIYVGGSPFYSLAEERRLHLKRKQRRETRSSNSEAEKSGDSAVEGGYGLFWRKELNWKFLAFEWVENGGLREEIEGHDFYP